MTYVQCHLRIFPSVWYQDFSAVGLEKAVGTCDGSLHSEALISDVEVDTDEADVDENPDQQLSSTIMKNCVLMNF